MSNDGTAVALLPLARRRTRRFRASTTPTLPRCTRWRPVRSYDDGDVIFRAGDADIDLFVVETGAIDILNPTDDNRLIVTHGPGEFAGDIDLLTRRPVIVTAVARGRDARCCASRRASCARCSTRSRASARSCIVAFQVRREQLTRGGVLGLKVVGPGELPRHDRRARVPLQELRPVHVVRLGVSRKARRRCEAWGSPRKIAGRSSAAAADCCVNPTLHELAAGGGRLARLPDGDGRPRRRRRRPRRALRPRCTRRPRALPPSCSTGSAPAGRRAGRRAIENFIGFPAGLSGAELATRGVLQMLKFGARWSRRSTSSGSIAGARDRRTATTLHLDCGATVRAQGGPRRDRRALAQARRARRRPLRARRHLLRLHDRRGVPARRDRTSPSSAPATPPGRRRCSWRSAAARDGPPARPQHAWARHDRLPRRPHPRRSRTSTCTTGVEVSAVHGERQRRAVELSRRRQREGDGGAGDAGELARRRRVRVHRRRAARRRGCPTRSRATSSATS